MNQSANEPNAPPRPNRLQSKRIVSGLRQCGYSVAVLSGVGKGFPDIVVGVHGRNYLFEIKDPDKSPSKRRLTDDETQFHTTWRGQYAVIHDLDEALKAINENRISCNTR